MDKKEQELIDKIIDFMIINECGEDCDESYDIRLDCYFNELLKCIKAETFSKLFYDNNIFVNSFKENDEVRETFKGELTWSNKCPEEVLKKIVMERDEYDTEKVYHAIINEVCANKLATEILKENDGIKVRMLASNSYLNKDTIDYMINNVLDTAMFQNLGCNKACSIEQLKKILSISTDKTVHNLIYFNLIENKCYELTVTDITYIENSKHLNLVLTMLEHSDNCTEENIKTIFRLYENSDSRLFKSILKYPNCPDVIKNKLT